MQQMDYETFVHRIVLELRGNLPKAYREYEVVVNCERGTDKRTAKLTLEKGATVYYKQVELAPYYEKYKHGEHWGLLMGEIRDSLVKPETVVTEKKKPEKKIATLAILVVFVLNSGILFIRHRRKY